MWEPFRILLAAALRDRLSLFWAVAAPAILLGLLGTWITDPSYRSTLVTGAVAFGSLGFAMSGTGFEVMRQRTRGVYKLLRITPFGTPAFVSIVAGTRCLVSLACGVAVATLGAAAFGTLRLSVTAAALMLSVLALGTLCFAFLGFTMGNLGANENQISLLNNLFLLPQILASGMFYGLARAPAWARAIGSVLPASQLLAAMRAAAAGDSPALAHAVLLLAVLTLLALALAVCTFRWDADAPFRLPRLGSRWS